MAKIIETKNNESIEVHTNDSSTSKRTIKFPSDGGLVVGSESDESKNIKLHRSGDSELQLVSGDDSTLEGLRSSVPADINSGKISSIEMETASSLNASGYISLTGYSKVDIVNMVADDLDWTQSNIFTKTISSNKTFTFSNDRNGQTLILKVENTDSSDHTITFPATIKWPGSDARGDITASAVNIYTFVKIDNYVYATSMEEMG